MGTKKFLHVSLVLVTFFTFTHWPISAAGGGVFYVANNGRENAAGTLTDPFNNIELTMAQTKQGDTVYVRQGTYYGRTKISVSGTQDAAIVLKAYPGEHPVLIDPENCTQSNALDVSGSYITIDGFKITSDCAQAPAVSIESGAHNVIIENSEIYKSKGQGIIVSGQHNTIYHNLIHDNGSIIKYHHGVYIEGGHNLIRGNWIYNNWGHGVQLYDEEGYDGSGNIIEKNRINNNGHQSDDAGYHRGSGIIIAQGHSGTTVRNNFICENMYGILVMDETTNNQITNNVTCNNKFGGVNFETDSPQSTVTHNMSTNDKIFALALFDGIQSDYNLFFNNKHTTVQFEWQEEVMSFDQFKQQSKQDANSQLVEL